jgi:cytochrome c oxidase subunit IV
MSETEAVHKPVNYGAIFWALLILTILEIIVANIHALGKPVIVVSLIVLAIIKASLVALFYMHLKFEKLIIYFICLFPLFLAAILTLMVLADKAPQLS